MTTAATGILFALKAASVKPPKASLDAIDIMKLSGGICGGCWRKIMQSTRNGSRSDTTKILWPLKNNKITFQWLKSLWDR